MPKASNQSTHYSKCSWNECAWTINRVLPFTFRSHCIKFAASFLWLKTYRKYSIHFNFCSVKLSWILDFSDFCVFSFVERPWLSKSTACDTPTIKINNLWHPPSRLTTCDIPTTKINSLWHTHYQDQQPVTHPLPRSTACDTPTTKINSLWHIHYQDQQPVTHPLPRSTACDTPTMVKEKYLKYGQTNSLL